jgi:hypothetical protein
MEGGEVFSESQVERGAERRAIDRRSNIERRFGERRSPDRATAGRRIQFVPDRRMLDRRGFQPA